jgi:hypothetical protein
MRVLEQVSHFFSVIPRRPEDRKRSHTLRYVLRNRTTGQVYLVILFTLYLKEDVNEDGSIKPEALEAAKKASGHIAHDEDDDAESFDEEKVLEHARRKLSTVDVDDKVETNDDDVD